MNKKIAFVSDFDGTITDNDFFHYIVAKYLNKTALSPWEQYLSGKLSHFIALKTIFSQIKINQQELDNFIKTIKLDKYRYKVWELCKLKEIPLYICSAGNDYYIKILIGEDIKKYDIKLITNPAIYDENNGLQMERIKNNSPYYNEEVGISKIKVIKELQAQGYYVIFAGDGPPDISPAIQSDTVFAKKLLLEKAKEINLATKNFESYNDIYNYIKELTA